jgi:hypothetical protein
MNLQTIVTLLAQRGSMRCRERRPGGAPGEDGQQHREARVLHADRDEGGPELAQGVELDLQNEKVQTRRSKVFKNKMNLLVCS